MVDVAGVKRWRRRTGGPGLFRFLPPLPFRLRARTQMMVMDGRQLVLHPTHAAFDALPLRMRLLDPGSLHFEKNDVLLVVRHMFPADADAAAIAYQGHDGLSLVVY